MLTIPEKFEELDYKQREYFAKLGFDYFKSITDSVLKSKMAYELNKTICKNHTDIIKALNEWSVKVNNKLDKLENKIL